MAYKGGTDIIRLAKGSTKLTRLYKGAVLLMQGQAFLEPQARYWRVKGVGHTGILHVGASQVQFRQVAGVEEFNVGGVATASSSVVGNPSMAFANNADSWVSSNTASVWLKYDFGAGNLRTIKEVFWRARWDCCPDQVFKTFDVQYSAIGDDNDANWTTYFGFAEEPIFGVRESRRYREGGRLSPGFGLHRYWKINWGPSNENAAVLFTEVELLAPGMDSYRDISVGGTPSGTTGYYSGGEGPAAAFDGNLVNPYQPPGNSELIYDFGAGNPKELIGFRVRRYGGLASRSPQTVALSYSDDGVTYTAAGPARTGMGTFDRWNEDRAESFEFYPGLATRL